MSRGRKPIPESAQKEIVRLRKRGLTNQDIAEQVGVSEHTVRRYAKGLGLDNRKTPGPTDKEREEAMKVLNEAFEAAGDEIIDRMYEALTMGAR